MAIGFRPNMSPLTARSSGMNVLPDVLAPMRQPAPAMNAPVSDRQPGQPRPQKPAVQAQPEKPKRSFGETVGRIGDILAIMGGRDPVYEFYQQQRMAEEQAAMQEQAFARYVANPNDQNAFAEAVAMRIDPKELLAVREGLSPPSEEPLTLGANERIVVPDGQGGYKEVVSPSPSAGGSQAKELQILNVLRDPAIAEERKRNPSLNTYLTGIEKGGAGMDEAQAARLALDLEKFLFDKRVAERELQLKEDAALGGGSAGADLTPTQRGNITQKLRLVPVAKKQYERVRQLYEEMVQEGTFARGGVAGLIPGAIAGGKAEEFDKALGALRKSILSMTRVPGVGSMSNYETMLDEQALPSRWGSDEGRLEAINNIGTLLDNYEAGYRDMLGNPVAAPAPARGGGGGQRVMPALPRGQRPSAAPRGGGNDPVSRAREEARRRGLL